MGEQSNQLPPANEVSRLRCDGNTAINDFLTNSLIFAVTSLRRMAGVWLGRPRVTALLSLRADFPIGDRKGCKSGRLSTAIKSRLQPTSNHAEAVRGEIGGSLSVEVFAISQW
jgi:hypothetical protein